MWARLALVLAVVAPSGAFACPVCGTAPEATQTAYQLMTVVMSLLPLAAIGVLVFLFFRRVRELEPPRPPLPSAPEEPKAR